MGTASAPYAIVFSCARSLTAGPVRFAPQGVDGVAEMAAHVHPDGWNLDSDQVEQDTGYLHMFASPTTELKKRVQQADNTDCLEHDCSGSGTDAHMQKEEREEARQEKEEETEITHRAREMANFAKISSLPPSISAFLAHKRHAQTAAHPHHPLNHDAPQARLTKVEKLVAKRQSSLLAAKDSLSRIVHPDSRHARFRASIDHIRSLEKIAPLPGLGNEGPLATRSLHARRARGRGKQTSLQSQEKGVRLLAKKWAARRKAAQEKMLHEAEIAQHKLEAARQKLI